MQVIAHLDLDAYFASIEQNDNPEYRGKPLIVGAVPPARGVVSTCSYEARKYGVHSAMPVSVAKRLCPEGIFVYPRFNRYSQISEKIFTYIKSIIAEVQQVSIDEAYMNLTGMLPLFSSYADIVKQIRATIKRDFGLNCTIGAACCKMLAKIATNKAKPDGELIILGEDTDSFLHNLPIEMIPGIGRKSNEKLKKYGIFLFKDLFKHDKDFLIKNFGKSILYYYNKIFFTEPFWSDEAKNPSVSSETTFDYDIVFSDDLRSVLYAMSSELCLRLRNKSKKIKTIGVKIRDQYFNSFQMQRTIDNGTFDHWQVFNLAWELTKSLYWTKIEPNKIRLFGLRLTSIIKEENNLFDTVEKSDTILKMVDDLNRKFGKDIIKKGISWEKED